MCAYIYIYRAFGVRLVSIEVPGCRLGVASLGAA